MSTCPLDRQGSLGDEIPLIAWPARPMERDGLGQTRPTGDGVDRPDHRPTVPGVRLVPIHLDYDEPVLGYHRVVAGLAASLAPPGGSVVDIGCGPGQLIGELAGRRHDLDLTGIDGDDECLRRAAERCPTATLRCDDIGRLTDLGREPLFDVVVSSHALEHLPDPVAALQRWASLLRQGGRLVIAVPNSLQPPLLGRALVRRPWANDGHFYIWDRATFENFCRLAGFQVHGTAVDYVPLVPVRIRRRLPGIAGLERALVRLLPQFSNSHIAVLSPGEAMATV